MMKSNVRMGGKLRWKGFQDRHDMFVGIAIGSIMTFFFMIIAYSGLGPKGGKFPEVNIDEDIQLHLEGFEWGNRSFFGNYYMKTRFHNYTYYKSILRLAEQYAPNARSVIDIGAPWPFVSAFDWIPYKVMLNDRYPKSISSPNIKFIEQNFYEYEPEVKFDLVLCNQVMEHVPDPVSFAQKLMSIGHTVIASVPYMWPDSEVFGHLHHFISHEHFLSWFGRKDYSELGIVQEVQRSCGDTCRRIYIVIRPPVPAADKLDNPKH